MKTIFLTLLGVFLALGLTVQAQQTTDKGFFTIQIKSLSKPVELSYFESESGVWEKKAADGLYKYFYGRYPDYASAREVAVKLKKGQYPDAFVVFSDKTIKPANTLDILKPASTVKAEARAASKTIAQSSGGTADKASFSSGQWTVQLAAFKYPMYIEDFKPLTNVMEFYCQDKMYRYCAGVYNSYDEAKTSIDSYKSAGQKGAFVVSYDKLKDYIIE